MDTSFVPKLVYCGEIHKGDKFFQQYKNAVESCIFAMITGHIFILDIVSYAAKTQESRYNAYKNYT